MRDFAKMTTASMAAQCRDQAAENLDPEYSAFMEAVALRLHVLQEALRESSTRWAEEIRVTAALVEALQPVAALHGLKPPHVVIGRTVRDAHQLLGAIKAVNPPPPMTDSPPRGEML